MISRLGPRTTCEPRASRVPIAMSLCPESSGATSGSSAFRSVDRSTSMYASSSASLDDQIACSARPRPGRSRWTARTSANVSSSERATGQVLSVLPLSAIVTRAVNGNPPRRYADEARDAWREIVLLVLDRDDDIYLGISLMRQSVRTGLGDPWRVLAGQL